LPRRQQRQLPPRSSFALGSKQHRVLNVVSGEVKITSTIAPSKHVTLTSNRWAQVMSLHQQIDVEVKETRAVAFRAHIGDEYYVSVTDGYSCVDICRFYIPYGLPCEHVRPTRSRLGLRLDEWAHLLELVPTIHERHPELATTEPCYTNVDHMEETQEGRCECMSCFLFSNRQKALAIR